MKKILLTESERKVLMLEKSKNIIESFNKTFNSIKRIDENEVNETSKKVYYIAIGKMDEPGEANAHIIDMGEYDEYEQNGWELRGPLSMDEAHEFMEKIELSNRQWRNNSYNDNDTDTDLYETPEYLKDTPDVQSSLVYKIVNKIDEILKGDIYIEPDENGQKTSYISNLFNWMFEAIFNEDYSKVLGFKKGDIDSFRTRLKKWLYNNDIILIKGGVVDIDNSNYPEIAKLVGELEKL